GKSTSYHSVDHFVKKLREDCAIHDLIAQQGIELLQIDNQPLDFRIHTNKNKYGHWTVTAAAGKVSGDHTVTTHQLHGGSVK
ncbi:YheC/YheD family protein, partial [Bacillus subtilis]